MLVRDPAADGQLGAVPLVCEAAIPLTPRLWRGRRQDMYQSRMCGVGVGISHRVVVVEVDDVWDTVLVDMVRIGARGSGQQLRLYSGARQRDHRGRARPTVLSEVGLERQPIG